MPECFFVSDLHGHTNRYALLFQRIEEEAPAAVFLGGDLLPSGFLPATSLDLGHRDFVNGYLAAEFGRLRERMGERYPRVFLILGNDDPRAQEAAFIDAASRGVWTYIHDRRVAFAGRCVYGYAFVPPTPFALKDWERYDVSRHVDPGCVSPEEGSRSTPVAEHHVRYATMQEDLFSLVGGAEAEVRRSIVLFHAPPYQTPLDRAALDGKMIDYAPLDVHVGSIAIHRLIDARQPAVTLHGHVHEAARLTGTWRTTLGATHCFTAAHDGPELALVRFDPDDPEKATRTLES